MSNMNTVVDSEKLASTSATEIRWATERIERVAERRAAMSRRRSEMDARKRERKVALTQCRAARATSNKAHREYGIALVNRVKVLNSPNASAIERKVAIARHVEARNVRVAALSVYHSTLSKYRAVLAYNAQERKRNGYDEAWSSKNTI